MAYVIWPMYLQTTRWNDLNLRNQDILHSANVQHAPNINSSFLISPPCNASKTCQWFAKTLFQSLNEKIDPCDDFYTHVCTGNRTKLSNIAVTDESVVNRLRQVISTTLETSTEIPEGLRNIYLTCLKPPKNLYKELVETFLYSVGFRENASSWPFRRPMKTNVSATRMSVIMAGIYRDLGISLMFEALMVNEDTVLLRPPAPFTVTKLGHVNEFVWMDRVMKLLTTEVFGRKSPHYDVASIEYQLNQLLGKHARQSVDCRKRPTDSNCYTITNLKMLPTSFFNWKTFFSVAFGVKPAHVVVESWPYLNALLSTPFETSNILNYYLFRVAIHFIALIEDEALWKHAAILTIRHLPDFRLAFEKNVSSGVRDVTRSDHCVHFLAITEPMLPLYVTRKAQWALINNATMTEVLWNAKRHVIEYVALIESVPRDFAMKLGNVINKTTTELFCSSRMENEDFRLNFVDGLYTNPASPVVYNLFYFVKNAAVRKMANLGHQTGSLLFRHSWKSGLLSTQPGLINSQNPVLSVPFGTFGIWEGINRETIKRLDVLRSAPKILRELFHSVQLDLLSEYGENSDEAFTLTNTKDCLIRQWKSSRGPKPPINAAINALSDVADLFALKFTQKMYKERIGGALGDVDWQLFFAFFAYTQCESMFQSGPLFSNPRWYRVNVPIRNSAEFARVFRCKRGTFMAPERLCYI